MTPSKYCSLLFVKIYCIFSISVLFERSGLSWTSPFPKRMLIIFVYDEIMAKDSSKQNNEVSTMILPVNFATWEENFKSSSWSSGVCRFSSLKTVLNLTSFSFVSSLQKKNCIYIYIDMCVHNDKSLQK
jgi:hypothetical protein